MEELKLKLSASEINSKEFQAKNGGYDALQVDRYLDLIVNDYIAFEQYENLTKKLYANYDELVKTCEIYKTKLSESEYQRTLLQEKVEVLKQNEGNATSNIELLQRISTLEQALYNLGKDPSKIK
ncbi:MAG: DivIVA domain-containing protein [Bacilli bacterium]